MKIFFAQPRGDPALGVAWAIGVLSTQHSRNLAPLYTFEKEIVHNKAVLRALAAKGAGIIDEVERVPAWQLTQRFILSTHRSRSGNKLAALSLNVVDATCPLVTKVHLEPARFTAAEQAEP